MPVLLFFVGLGALVLGAEFLVHGASRMAMAFGISPLVVGLTVVAFGTSAPELAVSLESALSGQVDIALGNVVGSNIFNVLFILGASALIAPLLVHRQLIRQEVPLMVGLSLLTWGLAANGVLSFFDGALLVGLLLAYTAFLIVQARRARPSEIEGESDAASGPSAHAGWDRHWAVQTCLILGGLALLVFGSRWLVESAVAFATWLGLSELVIGLTIVAAGTSLPELATSVVAAIRGERDIAVGNVVGSNVFNLGGVLGVSALVAPAGLPVPAGLLGLDLPVMVAVAVACLPIFFTGHRIARWEGLLFLAYYLAYTFWLVLHATQNGVAETYGAVMAGFVIPLTFLTLAVLAYRQRHQGRAGRGLG
jgi:cation:H+ antiporter